MISLASDGEFGSRRYAWRLNAQNTSQPFPAIATAWPQAPNLACALRTEAAIEALVLIEEVELRQIFHSPTANAQLPIRAPPFRQGFVRCASEMIHLAIDRSPVHQAGVIRTILDRLFPGRRHRRGLRFDRLHGIETSETVTRDGLTGMSAELREHAGEYIPTNPALFKRMMRKSGVDTSSYSFVDLGCGKGRIVIAAADYSFKAVLGVEADAALYEAAQENLKRWRQSDMRRRAQVVHADARTFDLPEGNLFIFMYSPFRGPIFEEVAKRLAAVAGEPDRAMVIAYSSDWEAEALERTKRFTRVRMRRWQFWAPPSVSFFYNETANRLRR